eukprot:5846768-Pleurochrysis_carterae.AAC.1
MQPSFRQTFIEPLIHGFTKDVPLHAIDYHLTETTALGDWSSASRNYIVGTIYSYIIPHSLEPRSYFNGYSVRGLWEEHLENFFERLKDAPHEFAFTGELNYNNNGEGVFPDFDWYKFEVLPAPKRLSFDLKSTEW